MVDIKGPGTDTSDNLRFLLSPGESVVTAKATRADDNKKLLTHLNRTGRSWRDFARREMPWLSDWTPPQLRPEVSDIVVTPAGETQGMEKMMAEMREQTQQLSMKLDEVTGALRWKQKEDREYRERIEEEAWESDNGHYAGDAIMWAQQHKMVNVASSVPVQLQKMAFLRGGQRWKNIQMLNIGVNLDWMQVSFLENAGTRGDAQGAIPVLRIADPIFAGPLPMMLTTKITGAVSIGIKTKATGSGDIAMWETDWVSE